MEDHKENNCPINQTPRTKLEKNINLKTPKLLIN